MYKRFEKFLFSSATVFALCLSVRELLIALDEPRGLGFLCGALTWLLLSAAQLQDAIVAFEDRLQRRLVSIPLALSTFFGFGAVVIGSFSDSLWTTFAALLLLMACALVYRKFTAVRASYDTVGSGYLGKNVWLNPPIDVIPDGALILTDGRMARRAKNSVGHSELVVKDANGKLHVVSSYIETGVVEHTLRAFIAVERRNKENYIVLVPREPLSVAQGAKLFATAEAVHDANKKWRDAENARRTWLFNKLPLPAKWRALLFKYAMSAGYDPLGKYWGGSRKDRYTCMAHNLHLLRAVEVPVAEYGTGAFGLFGEVNPLMPVRFMTDPAYRVLTTEDKRAFDASRPAVSSCGCG